MGKERLTSNRSKSSEKQLRWSRQETKSAAEIGDIPDPENLERRAACYLSLENFKRTYMPNRFSLTSSRDQEEATEILQQAVLTGCIRAFAMPRASGKTAICEAACLWAMLNGHWKFAVYIAATFKLALQRLAGLKREIEMNPLIVADFPEVSYPVRALEGRSRRNESQTYQGRPTYLAWHRESVVFPTIPSSLSSGSCIQVYGLTSAIRGLNFVQPDGTSVRPDGVIADDPQTRKSAKSEGQCDDREELLKGDVLGLAGPGKKISLVVPCTIIRKGDLADRILDRERNPEFQGTTYKMVYTFPKQTLLWEDYSTRRHDELRNGGDGSNATEFYRQNQERMDDGAIVAWPARFTEGNEISGVQHAMNLYFRDKAAFFSEYQNDPLEDILGSGDQLTASPIAMRVNGLPRGTVPLRAANLTAFVDVGERCLWWAVGAFANDFSGSVISYGTYPDQRRRYFTGVDVQQTMERAAPGCAFEAMLLRGLDSAADLLLNREWAREDGAAMRIGLMLIDASWGKSTEVVKQWCRTTRHAALVKPYHGRGITASMAPWSEYKEKPGEKMGLHCLVSASPGKHSVRHVLADVNWWKTFCASRLKTPVGDKGALTLWGKPGEDHEMISHHWTSEYAEQTSGRGRTLEEWRLRPGRDNHWWDCLVGASVAASMLGSQVVEGMGPQQKKREVLSNAELRRRYGSKAR